MAMVIIKETRNGDVVNMMKTEVARFSLSGTDKAAMFTVKGSMYNIKAISENDMMRVLLGNVIITIEIAELDVITSIESL